MSLILLGCSYWHFLCFPWGGGGGGGRKGEGLTVVVVYSTRKCVYSDDIFYIIIKTLFKKLMLYSGSGLETIELKSEDTLFLMDL